MKGPATVSDVMFALLRELAHDHVKHPDPLTATPPNELWDEAMRNLELSFEVTSEVADMALDRLRADRLMNRVNLDASGSNHRLYITDHGMRTFHQLDERHGRLTTEQNKVTMKEQELKRDLQVVFDLAKRRLADSVQTDSRRTAEEMTARGLMNSSNFVGPLWKRCLNTLRDAAHALENEAKRVLVAHGATTTSVNRELVVKEFEALLDAQFEAIHSAIRSNLNSSSDSGFRTSAEAQIAQQRQLARSEMIHSFTVMVMESKKAAASPASAPAQVIQVTGHASRVTFGSDNSVNTVNITSTELFEKLRLITNEKLPEGERSAIVAAINRLEAAPEKSKPWIEAYGDFMRLIASHATVFGQLIPALTQLLTS